MKCCDSAFSSGGSFVLILHIGEHPVRVDRAGDYTSDLNCQTLANAREILRWDPKFRQDRSQLTGIFFVCLIHSWGLGQVVT